MDLVKQIQKRRSQTDNSVFVVGISGFTGSGKSTLAATLQTKLPNCLVLAKDEFFAVKRTIWKEKLEREGVDLNVWYDLQKIRAAIKRIKKNEVFAVTDLYDLSKGTFSGSKKFDASTCNFLVVEGLLALGEVLQDLIDFRIFVDTSEEQSIVRAKKRDFEERSYTARKWNVKMQVLHEAYIPHAIKHRMHADVLYKSKR